MGFLAKASARMLLAPSHTTRSVQQYLHRIIRIMQLEECISDLPLPSTSLKCISPLLPSFSQALQSLTAFYWSFHVQNYASNSYRVEETTLKSKTPFTVKGQVASATVN